MDLGNNISDTLTFLANSYTYPSGKVVSFNNIELKTVLISVSQATKLIKTEVQGLDGTVKEYIGKDDYYITVTGVINGEFSLPPTAKVNELKKMLDCPVVIEVVSPWLQNIGVYQAIVETYDLPQMPGGVGYQTFTINLVSDTPTELIIEDV